MFMQNTGFRLSAITAFFLFLLVGMSTALADQVTLTFVDADSNAQTLTIDVNSSAEDLALAASLMGEDGVGLDYDDDNGSGSLADIAAALAGAAPMYAADIAETLSRLSPDDSEAIVAAVNGVPGVNTVAVRSAVHFGDPDRDHGPQEFDEEDSHITVELHEIERVPSDN